MNDSDLIERFLSGDAAALDELVRRHTDFIYGVARRRAGASHAEDITQAVWIVLVKKARSLRRRGSLVGWLHRVTCFCCTSVRRLEDRRRTYEREAAMRAVRCEQAGLEEWLEDLDGAIQRLGRREREVVLLHYLKERSYPETAAVLRITEAAARKRAARGVEKLRVLLGQREPAAGLAGVLQFQAAMRAPDRVAVAGLAAAQAAVKAGGTAGAIATLMPIVKTTLHMLHAAQIAATATVGAVVVMASVVGVELANQVAHARPPQPVAVADGGASTSSPANAGPAGPMLDGVFKQRATSLPTVSLKMSLSGDGKSLLSLNYDLENDPKPVAYVVDTSNGLVRQMMPIPGIVVWRPAVSADGTLGAIAQDRTLAIYDLSTGQPAGRVDFRVDLASTCAFSPDARILAAADTRDTVRWWDWRQAKELGHVADAPAKIAALAIAPDDRTMVMGGAALEVWQLDPPKRLHALEGHLGLITSVSYSANGKWIVSTSTDRTIRIWDAATGAHLQCLRGHVATVRAAIFSPDARRIVSEGGQTYNGVWRVGVGGMVSDPMARIWDVQTAAELAEAPIGMGEHAFGLQPESQQILVTNGRFMRYLDISSALRAAGDSPPVLKPTPVDHPWAGQERVLAVGTVPQGAWLVTGDKEALIVSDQGRIARWGLATGKPSGSDGGANDGTSEVVKCFDLSADRQRALVEIRTGALQVVHRANPREAVTIAAEGVMSARLSPDGGKVITGHADRKARIWDARSGALLRTLEGHESAVTAAVFSDDGRHVATGANPDLPWGQGTLAVRQPDGEMGPPISRMHRGNIIVRVWDVDSGKLLCTSTSGLTALASGGPPGGLAAGGMVASAGPAGSAGVDGPAGGGRGGLSGGGQALVVADPTVVTRAIALGELRALAFSPDGGLLAVCAGFGIIDMMDTRTGMVEAEVGQPAARDAVFSRDGRRLLTCGGDGTVREWDLVNNREMVCFGQHTDEVLSVRFSEDEQRAISAGADQTVRVFKLP